MVAGCIRDCLSAVEQTRSQAPVGSEPTSNLTRTVPSTPARRWLGGYSGTANAITFDSGALGMVRQDVKRILEEGDARAALVYYLAAVATHRGERKCRHSPQRCRNPHSIQRWKCIRPPEGVRWRSIPSCALRRTRIDDCAHLACMPSNRMGASLAWLTDLS